MTSPLVLVSHTLCPYVQRVAIVLTEKGIAFERKDVDLANKPTWFLQASPLGKTPLLLLKGEVIFESMVICEYLEDTNLPRLHPGDPLMRAKHRSWMEFGSALLSSIGRFYNAADETALAEQASDIRSRMEQLEHAIGTGPYFAGEVFSMVDAVFAPVFRYFDVFDAIGNFGFWSERPNVLKWRQNLLARPSVAAAVSPDYPELLRRFLLARNSALSARLSIAQTIRTNVQVGAAYPGSPVQ